MGARKSAVVVGFPRMQGGVVMVVVVGVIWGTVWKRGISRNCAAGAWFVCWTARAGKESARCCGPSLAEEGGRGEEGRSERWCSCFKW